MKYIKLFETTSDYNTFKQLDDFIAPNVSLVENEDEIHYNPLIIINPSVTMADWTYGETASNPVISGNTGNGIVTYMYKVSSADDSTYTSTIPTDVGTYIIKATIEAKGQYSSGLCTTTFTISKASINPSVTISDWKEGETASDPVVSGNTDNGNVTYLYKVSSADDSTYTTIKPSTSGTYTVKATIDATVNYNGSVCTTTFTIKVNVLEGRKILCKYNITDTNTSTKLSGYISNFSSMEVDGIEQEVAESYTFDTTGEHNVLFTLAQNKTGYQAFRGCSKLTNVIIGNSVTTITNDEFRGCSGLTNITIPSSVTSIGANAFDGCRGLTSITIPNSVTSINTYAFYNCSGLTNITIPDSIKAINTHVFEGCSELTNVTIPDSVTSIGQYAFSACSKLTSLTIPDLVTSIGQYAFSACFKLTSVTIPDSVTTIGGDAFMSCSGLTSISVDVNNQTYDSRNNCNAIIETSTNTLILGCKNTIISDSVTSIGDSAFYNCSGLTSITIPNSVTSIGASAFYKCSGLTNITCNTITAPTIQNNTLQAVKSGGVLTVPTGSTGYDVWMGTGNYYLGKYNWTKVEQ